MAKNLKNVTVKTIQVKIFLFVHNNFGLKKRMWGPKTFWVVKRFWSKMSNKKFYLKKSGF